MTELNLHTDYLFEVSWEVCNKIGGIHTVISTKAPLLTGRLNDNYITIGPDVWKETHRNPEFVEDHQLFREWREHAAEEGLHMRIGRWQVSGEPLAILVDFTPLFGDKDKIFTNFWLKYGLNSLSGRWDYTEPAMFGYAAGQVIESFYDYYLSAKDTFVAHFHEWMTGTGVLYLNDKVPQAGTVFTTHATVVGRSMAGHGKPLYTLLNQIDAEIMARELGVTSKHSLEQVAAAAADAFTTVGGGTARECEHLLLKKPDLITPNGFHAGLLPSVAQLGEKRQLARSRLLKVARGLFNQNLPDETLLVAHSGRYEFRNKGIDLLINALGELNKTSPSQNMVAFLMVPADQNGPRKEVLQRIKAGDYKTPLMGEYHTHQLGNYAGDPIINGLREAGLMNRPEDKVKVVFVPAYLNGNDGLMDLSYYDLLIGFDASVFPSYYEPWGYTPMESTAMRIPTITTSLSGFGHWVKSRFEQAGEAVHILERDDHNQEEVIRQLKEIMANWLNAPGAGKLTGPGHETDPLSQENLLTGRKQSRDVAESILWDKQIRYYLQAYELATGKVKDRHELYKDKLQPVHRGSMPSVEAMRPRWKKISIEIHLPEALSSLSELARNIWWTWNYEARELFESIDPALWAACDKNPVIMMDKLSVEHYDRLTSDKEFMGRYKEVIDGFRKYMDAGNKKTGPKIAYFSMEYGLHESIKIYSGGLGVLAGDYLKAASDDNVDIIGIGLLYRYGYFSQNLSARGEQLDTYHRHDFGQMSAVPVRDANGDRMMIQIAFPGRTLHARVYRIDVGRVPLYLLDTDISENAAFDRFITHQLYGGDWENRFKQEFLLGIGGIRMLEALGLKPDLFHCNEGHAAFIGLERLRSYVQEQGLLFQEALEVVRASSLFTTHTPVPAGHDFFSEDMLRAYMPHYATRLGIDWSTFMALGKMNPENKEETYSMSVLAAKLSQQVNGVSRIHGHVAREMFSDLYPGYFPRELHIDYVTNGVHYGTWTAKDWQQLYRDTFGSNFAANVADPGFWEKIHNVPDQKIWSMRNERRKKLMAYIKKRLLSNLQRRQETPRKIYQLMEAIDDKTLTIGFARRFATYKRAHLLFNDLERLSSIVNNPDMPVQFIYAGKAHPADKAGQDLIRYIVEISRKKEFRGKILFLEDYDMELGRELVKGVDIWLNTPTRPQEASGTSGQKAILNGVMNFSVLDGWWAEGYKEEAGWMLKEEKTFENQDFQNELDAETIYSILESELIPMYYNRDEDDIPKLWVRWIKNSIAGIGPHFTNKRMLDDYFSRFYNKLFASAEKMKKNDYALARKMVRWKNKVLRGWESVHVVNRKLHSNSGKTLLLGQDFVADLTLDLNGLKETDLGVEVVFVQKSLDGSRDIASVYELELIHSEGKLVTYKCEVAAKRTGVFNYAFRIFPKHPELAHRQDFSLVRWI